MRKNIIRIHRGFNTLRMIVKSIEIHQPHWLEVFFAWRFLWHSVPSIFSSRQHRGTQHFSPCRLWKCPKIAVWERKRWTMCQDFRFEPIEVTGTSFGIQKEHNFSCWWPMRTKKDEGQSCGNFQNNESGQIWFSKGVPPKSPNNLGLGIILTSLLRMIEPVREAYNKKGTYDPTHSGNAVNV